MFSIKKALFPKRTNLPVGNYEDYLREIKRIRHHRDLAIRLFEKKKAALDEKLAVFQSMCEHKNRKDGKCPTCGSFWK